MVQTDPHQLLEMEPRRARQLLEQIAAEAARERPGDWRIPLRAALDALFAIVEPDPVTVPAKRKYRTKRRLCKCGCGTVIRPLVRTGPPPDYVDSAHRMRALRARRKEENPK